MPGRTIGLIAGNGRFPVLFATAARREGVRVVAVAHQGETAPEIESLVDSLTWVKVGELGKIIRTFRDAGVREAVMAGGIRKVRAISSIRPDLRGARFLARVRTFQDDALLRGVADELARDGIEIVSSTIFLPSIVAGEGRLGARTPSRADWRDIALGFEVAKGVGRWDVGQSVVVKNKVVLAVEGVEGTDACIRRGAELASGAVVLVKVAKPSQDLRFDVPAVGPETVATMVEAGGGVIAVEAGKTLLLDREEFLRAADSANIPVVGVSTASLSRDA